MGWTKAIWAKNKAKTYTDTKFSQIPKGIVWKGEVDYYSSLPASPSEGDAYTVRYTGTSGTNPSGAEYAWGKDYSTQQYKWVEFGGSGGSGADPTALAPAYDATATYAVGDLCTQSYKLYKCNTEIPTAEAWTAAHWTETSVEAEFSRSATITVTCVTQDGVTVTGQTVTLRKGTATGEVFATAAYNGQPVSFSVPKGFEYYVSVSNTLAGHFSPTTASGIANTLVIAVTLTYDDASSITTYAGVAQALTALADPTVMIGNVEIADTWIDENGTSYSDPMLVAAVQTVTDADGETHTAAVMVRKWATKNSMQFDAAEAEEATEATAQDGVYYAGLTGTTFTKLNLSTGDTVPYSDYDKVFHNGINFDDNMRKNGYNRWGHSAMRQYLNSSAAVGAWWAAQHTGDCAPSQLATTRGYKAGCSAALLAAAKPIKVKCMLNTVTDGGAEEETVDTFWLPSGIELFGTSNAGEGTFFPYYKTATGLTMPSDAANAGRIHYGVENHSSAQLAWLRSPGRSHSCHVWLCYSSGQLINGYAAYSYRAVPACAIY